MAKTKAPHISNELFSISKKVGAAIADYNMLTDGDKIILAISGGKDSLSLLKLFKYRQTFIPIDIEIMAVHIDMGVPHFPLAELESYFQKEQFKYHIEKIDILNGKDWSEINCFWCSWNRRKCLFQLAERFGYNKVALGHHMDDIVETTLLNMFYNGEISTMRPKQELFKGKFHLIRPLSYVKEEEIKQLIAQEGLLNIDKFQCPNNDTSRRMMIKDLLCKLSKENPAIKKNIYRSLERIKDEYLLNKQ